MGRAHARWQAVRAGLLRGALALGKLCGKPALQLSIDHDAHIVIVA